VKSYDIAIVGGGLIGASIAFELASEKLRVIVLDRQQPGQEASWAAAGMLSPAPDSPRDIPLVSLSLESLRLYPDYIGAIGEFSKQSTGYKTDGAIEIFSGPAGERDRDERVAECRRLGIAIELISIENAREWEGAIGPTAAAAAWLPKEGTVEPRLLMSAVLDAARNRGVEFRADAAVTGFAIEGGRCSGVFVGGEKIGADQVILAAGSFCNQLCDEIEGLAPMAPTRPVRGQMMALRPDAKLLGKVLRSKTGYLVPRGDGRIVAGSTSEEAGFEKRVTAGGIRKILDNALELAPALSDAEIVETWSGLRPGTPDDLPILGPSEIEGLLIATGHYRNGILLAAVTAKLVREWITRGQTTLDASRFSPLRFAESKAEVQRAR
jgi:glycine oxidase